MIAGSRKEKRIYCLKMKNKKKGGMRGKIEGESRSARVIEYIRHAGSFVHINVNPRSSTNIMYS